MKAIASIILAVELLLSTLNLNISMHYCGGKLAHFSFTGEAQKCLHEKTVTFNEPCPIHQEITKKNNNCCDDRNLVIKGKEVVTPIAKTLVLNPLYVLLSTFPIHLSDQILSHESNIFHIPDKTPLELHHYLALVQTFLL